MKTTTYLRLSLLIPFLVWGVCVLLFAITNATPGTGGLVINSIIILFLFYVFGIIGWLLPYLLLSLLLLILSFKIRVQTLIKVFALSPIAMAVFIVLFVTLVLGSGDTAAVSPDLATGAGEFFGAPVWFGIVTLVWGYLCVAIGFSIYKLLQRLQIIRDIETRVTPAITEAA
jgi:hypothetical protein